MEIERDVALDGSAAVVWMRNHGWRVIGPTEDLKMTADSARSPEFVLKRIWHTSAVTAIELPEDCEDFKFVTFIYEGSVTLLTNEGTRRVSAPSHFFIDETMPVQMVSTEPHSRLILGLPKSMYHWMPDELTLPARPYRAEALYRDSLLSSALTSLRGSVQRAAESDRHWTAGMESLALAAVFSATINDRDEGDAVPTPEEAEETRELLADALAFIELNGHDPKLSVGRLAEHLGVSRSQLYRAFQPTGLAPGAHLRRARAQARAHTRAMAGISNLVERIPNAVAVDLVNQPLAHKLVG